MSVIISNKNIPNNGMKEAGTSYEGLSLGSLRRQGLSLQAVVIKLL